MRLTLVINVPASADLQATERVLNRATYLKQGITITTSEGYNVDVDLLDTTVDLEVAR